jgi:carbamoyltransferase
MSLWIAGLARGHNAGVCLMKDGEIVFSIEEERLTRTKYDGGPLASILKILEYTDRLDYMVISHTESLDESAGRIDYINEDIYTGLARKMGLIESGHPPDKHPQVIDAAKLHHKMHASLAFYRSGFKEAVAVVIDGAGTYFTLTISGHSRRFSETETIFKCSYPNNIRTLHKPIGSVRSFPTMENEVPDTNIFGDIEGTYIATLTDRAGIVKCYEAVTEYCGWESIEAGKTMGLFPYGKENDDIPPLFDTETKWKLPLSNRNLFVTGPRRFDPRYPGGTIINEHLYGNLSYTVEGTDLTLLQNRRDMAYAVQKQTQQAVVDHIRYAVKISGSKNVVISGGYGLNCVANYYYLDTLKNEGINIYVEPISSDAGTAMGAALLLYHSITKETTVKTQSDNVYLGPLHTYSEDHISYIANRCGASVTDATIEDVVELLVNRNIVSLFQGRSENGPRALGNRSILYDPTDPNGKDFVNEVKRREYFRPFAGSILEEDVHEWFDLRGMKSSPTMMYAVNCHSGVEKKIPAIIHIDGTCRVQTVNRKQNPHFYDIIRAFKEKTGCPIVLNTSFNLGGDPLVETLEDALMTLKRSRIEYLYLPEYSKLITIENQRV